MHLAFTGCFPIDVLWEMVLNYAQDNMADLAQNDYLTILEGCPSLDTR